MPAWNNIEIPHRSDAPPLAASIRPGVREPVFCLHGIQGRRQIFDKLADVPQLAEHTLVAIDFPGFGQSAAGAGRGDRMQALAEDVQAAARSLGTDRFHVIGHSLGGMVGTLLLSKPDLVLSLVNLEGNLTAADCGASAVTTRTSRENFERSGFDALVANVATETGPSVESRLAALGQTTARTFYETAASIVSWSQDGGLLDLFTNSRIPRCLVVGEKNKQKADVLPRHIQRYVIEGAGHFMLLDAPAVTIRVIADWLKGQSL